MSDPVEHWLSRYFLDVAAGAAAGLGTVAGWARVYRLALEKKIADLDTRTNEHIQKVEADVLKRLQQVDDDSEHCYQTRLNHGQDIAVLKADQRNTEDWLAEIRETTRSTNQKLDDLIMEVKRRR